MKNPRVKYAVALLIVGLISQSANGQVGTVRGTAVRGTAVRGSFGWTHDAGIQEIVRPASPLGGTNAISYFEGSTPTHSWFIPSLWASAEMLGLTECITLPADSGFIDSVRIVFDTIAGDSIGVVLDPDTVLLNSAAGGEYEHLDATVFNSFLNSYAQATIYPSELHSDTVTVPFPHVRVPMNFHVALVPSISTTGVPTSLFAIRGDSEASRARTLENARSTFIVVSGGRVFSGVIDSNLVPPGDTVPLYSNMYITAYVSAAPSAVTTASSENGTSIFPNPASSFLQFSKNGDGADSVEIIDALGRTVLSASLVGTRRIDISQLEPGNYEALVHGTHGSSILPIVIQR